MSKNQKVAFWSMYIGFCFVATAVIYPQGAFKNLELGGASLLSRPCKTQFDNKNRTLDAFSGIISPRKCTHRPKTV